MSVDERWNQNNVILPLFFKQLNVKRTSEHFIGHVFKKNPKLLLHTFKKNYNIPSQGV